MIRYMKPDCLSQALQYVMEGDNAHYFQTFNEKNIIEPQKFRFNNPFQHQNNFLQ